MGTPIHVRGAIMYNHMLTQMNLTKKYQSIKGGDKVKFCYMKVNNPANENVFSCMTVLPKEFKLDRYIDYNKQFEKAYIEPLKFILETIGWNVEKKSTLERFFL